MKMYTRVPSTHQRTTGGTIITTMWLDVRKCDEKRPARLVGREHRKGHGDTLYAPTPALDGPRTITSRAAAYDNDRNHNNDHDQIRHSMVNDVRRAYFHARATIYLYIELPQEDEQADGSMSGKLNLPLYGTRGAAATW